MSNFARRLTIEQIRHAGVAIVPANFVVSRKPLVYGFKTLAVGTPVPDFMPRHKIVQFHRMRRLDVAPNVTGGQATAPRFKRNAGDTAPVAAAVTVSVVVPVTPVAAPVVVAAESKASRAARSKPSRPVAVSAGSNDDDSTSTSSIPDVDVPVDQFDE